MGHEICPFTYSSLSALGEGCPDSFSSAPPPSPRYPQVVAEACYLSRFDALPALHQLTHRYSGTPRCGDSNVELARIR
jgi:hypothetical protein